MPWALFCTRLTLPFRVSALELFAGWLRVTGYLLRIWPRVTLGWRAVLAESCIFVASGYSKTRTGMVRTVFCVHEDWTLSYQWLAIVSTPNKLQCPREVHLSHRSTIAIVVCDPAMCARPPRAASPHVLQNACPYLATGPRSIAGQ